MQIFTWRNRKFLHYNGGIESLFTIMEKNRENNIQQVQSILEAKSCLSNSDYQGGPFIT